MSELCEVLLLSPAIQMGRPTKYTASAAGYGLTDGISQEINFANSSISTSHLGHVIAPWYQVLSWKSLVQQHLLAHHPSVHTVGAVNPWLMTSPDVSLSPDSTVKDMEQTSNEIETVTKHQLDALDLCQKSVASTVIPIRNSLMPHSAANISTSSVTATGSSTEELEQARDWLQCGSTSSVVAHMSHSTRHKSDPVLNLSVKSLELCRKKSSLCRTATTLSHSNSYSDTSGCLFCFTC